jgi:HD superfamily phosphohydrolase
MYRSVYFHPTVVCAEKMLSTAVEESSLDGDSTHMKNDRELHSKLITDSSEVTRDLYNRVVNRNLYKEYKNFHLPDEQDEFEACKTQLEQSDLEWYEWFVVEHKPTTSNITINIDLDGDLVQYTDISSVDQNVLADSYLPDVRIFIIPDYLD